MNGERDKEVLTRLRQVIRLKESEMWAKEMKIPAYGSLFVENQLANMAL
jgi:hypothetical protein